MAVKLRLVSDSGGDARVAADGDVVVAGSAGELVNPFEGVLGTTWSTRRVLLDFTRAGFIDSAGIGWLIGSAKRFREAGGALVVHSIPPRVKQMLDMLKVGQVVPMAANEAAAQELLTKGGAAAGGKK